MASPARAIAHCPPASQAVRQQLRWACPVVRRMAGCLRASPHGRAVAGWSGADRACRADARAACRAAESAASTTERATAARRRAAARRHARRSAVRQVRWPGSGPVSTVRHRIATKTSTVVARTPKAHRMARAATAAGSRCRSAARAWKPTGQRRCLAAVEHHRAAFLAGHRAAHAGHPGLNLAATRR